MTKRSSAAVALPRRCRGDAPRRRARDRPTRKTAAAPLDRVRSLSLRGATTRSTRTDDPSSLDDREDGPPAGPTPEDCEAARGGAATRTAYGLFLSADEADAR
mmetsp:Transcript_6441/g.20273  ORF Transcript_6441/g.20273 Transcript_6441/m.20273 type:complete len:103 (+) Transcript_6441:1078-1386(+)